MPQAPRHDHEEAAGPPAEMNEPGSSARALAVAAPMPVPDRSVSRPWSAAAVARLAAACKPRAAAATWELSRPAGAAEASACAPARPSAADATAFSVAEFCSMGRTSVTRASGALGSEALTSEALISEALTSEALAKSRDICCWLALRSSMVALSCTISCRAFASSPAIEPCDGAVSADGAAAAGAAASALVWAALPAGAGSAVAVVASTAGGVGCCAGCGDVWSGSRARSRCGVHWAIIVPAASP